jgi:hypothetical protein
MTNRARKIFLALMVSAATAAAQDSVPSPTPAPPPAATTDASAVILAPRTPDYVMPPPVDSDGQSRSVSPAVAAALADGRPHYQPPTPTPTPGPEIDARDVDKPKNGIRRLPKYIVQEARPPIFRERDLYTARGQIDLSFKAHAGLNFGNILGLNEGPAAQMYLDDQRSANIADLTDLSHVMSRGGDRAEGSFILQQSQSTYMRQDDNFNWSGPGGGGTNSGGWGK